MTLWRLIAKEIAHRKLSFALGLLSVAAAIGCLVGSLALLKHHDARTGTILALKEAETRVRMADLEDDMRKAMLKLGFNLVILPKSQDLGEWHAQDYGETYMPEEYADRLAQSGIVTVRHLLPSLQQKIVWPEQNMSIILIGTRGEVPNIHKDPKKPLVQPVLPGTIVLGHALCHCLGLSEGDSTTLLGQEFFVAACHPERGTKDDITAWISLPEAQALLGKEGLINAILAIECICAPGVAPTVRSDIMAVLPDTQVIERESQVLARAEARHKVAQEARAALEEERRNRAELRDERERLASVLVPAVMGASALWIALLALGNVRERRSEIALLRALGLGSRHVLAMFVARSALMGLVGGSVGLGAGLLAGRQLAISTDKAAGSGGSLVPLAPGLILLALLMAPLLAALASWAPALWAALQDPAEILREE